MRYNCNTLWNSLLIFTILRSDDCTPYVHTMTYHLPHFLKRFQYIDDIATHQLERKNYDQRVCYFAGTQRGGGRHPVPIAVQILQRENRLLYANFYGHARL